MYLVYVLYLRVSKLQTFAMHIQKCPCLKKQKHGKCQNFRNQKKVTGTADIFRKLRMHCRKGVPFKRPRRTGMKKIYLKLKWRLPAARWRRSLPRT